MSEKWVSGYHGEDSMRHRAHQMLGHELKAAKKGKIPESMSSPGHTKMRPFAEGGHAEGGKMKKGGHSKHHKITHEQTDMHIPRRAKSAPIHRMSQEKAENLKRGGKAGTRLNIESFKEAKKEARFAEGGHANGGCMRRGGKAHHHRKHRAEGGDMGGMPPQTPPFGTAQTPQMQQPMRKGGHMKHRKASGGSIYEHQMNGEKPSRKAHHYNYEAEMKGEHPVKKPSSRHESKKGLVDKEHGQLFAKGGHSKHRAEGGKMAAGGVGKIRHKAATASGKPKGAKRVIRNDMF